jgi:PiT family inorganic phosphate transporter
MINAWTLLWKVVVFFLLSPILGAVLARAAMWIAQFFESSRNPSPWMGEGKGGGGTRAGPWASLQVLGLLFEGMGHGANNVQKCAALIFMLLLSAGSSREDQVPLWAMLGCSAGLAAGVPVGGWKIARILNGKSFKVTPAHSLASQAAAAVVLAGANLLGGVLSPNQLVKASFLGTGAGGPKETPWWILGKNAITAWLIHLPACALLSAAVYWCAGRAMGLGMGSLERIMSGLGT